MVKVLEAFHLNRLIYTGVRFLLGFVKRLADEYAPDFRQARIARTQILHRRARPSHSCRKLHFLQTALPETTLLTDSGHCDEY